MPQRDEPRILADLIRLHSRLELENETLGLDTAADAELIEQARAALHRYVVARGKAQLTLPRAPLNLWTGACFAAGVISTGVSMLFGFPLSLSLIAALLVIAAASFIIDRKQI